MDAIHDADDGQGLEAALSLFREVSDVWWHPPLLTLLAARSHYLSAEVVRIPVYLVAGDPDSMLLRSLIVSQFLEATICVHALSQTSLVQTFLSEVTEGTLAMDLTDAGEAIVPFIRHYARARSVPNNHISVAGIPQAIYGDSVFIVSEEATAVLGTGEIVLDLRKRKSRTTPPSNLAARALAAIKNLATSFRPGCVPCSQLPSHPYINGSVAHGFHHLEQLAGLANERLPSGAFLDSVHAAWLDIGRAVSQASTSRLRRSLLCRHILAFLQNDLNKPEKNGAYREDRLAAYVRTSDPELFALLDQTALGKALSRLGIGTVSRAAIRGDGDGPPRVWRSCVTFSEADKKRLQEESSDESQD